MAVEATARSRVPARRERMTEGPNALYFLPLPQGQRSLWPMPGGLTRGLGRGQPFVGLGEPVAGFSQ